MRLEGRLKKLEKATGGSIGPIVVFYKVTCLAECDTCDAQPCECDIPQKPRIGRIYIGAVQFPDQPLMTMPEGQSEGAFLSGIYRDYPEMFLSASDSDQDLMVQLAGQNEQAAVEYAHTETISDETLMEITQLGGTT